MDFIFECLLNILPVTDHKDRLWIEHKFQLVQPGWTNPNVLSKHLAPNFTKSQMVSILLYINGMIVYLLLVCCAIGMGLIGETRTNNAK